MGENPRERLRDRRGKKRGDAACLPLAARVCVANEIGTVLINGVISQVHADVILEEETESVGSEEGQASRFLPWPLGLKEMERKGEVSGLTVTGRTEEVKGILLLEYKKLQFLLRWGGACPRDTSGVWNCGAGFAVGQTRP